MQAKPQSLREEYASDADTDVSSTDTEVASTDRTCHECGGDLRQDGDETVCVDCGLVADVDNIDHGPEWRSFDDESRRRTGMGHTERRHDNGLGSEIGFDTIEDSEKRSRLTRMRREHTRGSFGGKRMRNRANALAETRRICDQLSVAGPIVDRACRLVHEGHEAGIAQGRSLEALSAAAVTAAIRDTGLAIPMSEVQQYSNADRRRLHVVLRQLIDVADVDHVPVEPVEHIPRLVSDADIVGDEREVEALARELCLEAQDRGLQSGKLPHGFAAAAVYTASKFCNGGLTQEGLAELADVSTPTVRNRSQDLIEAGVAEEVC